jgi:hypothetical protein
LRSVKARASGGGAVKNVTGWQTLLGRLAPNDGTGLERNGSNRPPDKMRSHVPDELSEVAML